jgi:hypothetical protein
MNRSVSVRPVRIGIIGSGVLLPNDTRRSSGPWVSAECALRAPDEGGLHLSPVSLAQMARAAVPEVLIPVHLYPEVHPDELPDLLRKAGYTGRVEMGRDGLALAVGSSDVRIPSSPHSST